jgi:hypothetical protein
LYLLKKKPKPTSPKICGRSPICSTLTIYVKRSNFQNKRKNDKLGVSKLTEGLKKGVQWNKGDCVITDRTASRRKDNARYFFSRMKALNAATIPEFKEGRVNAYNLDDEIFRQREWNYFNTRVQTNIQKPYEISCQ